MRERTMKKTLSTLAIAGLALPFAWACATDGSSGTQTSAANGGTTSRAPATSGTTGGTTASTGGTAAPTAGASAPAATGSGSNTAARTPTIPSLVNVNLQNVLNDLSVKLNLDRANVPINIQLPIQLAANVCGVSVNVLAVSTGGQANCSAKSAPQELTQAVQQQLAAGGSVGGGAQSTTTGGTGAATGGASNTSATSSGQGAPITPPK
jgi:hypothetical protein